MNAVINYGNCKKRVSPSELITRKPLHYFLFLLARGGRRWLFSLHAPSHGPCGLREWRARESKESLGYAADAVGVTYYVG